MQISSLIKQLSEKSLIHGHRREDGECWLYTGVLLTLEVESSGIINIEGCNQLKKELHIARQDFF